MTLSIVLLLAFVIGFATYSFKKMDRTAAIEAIFVLLLGGIAGAIFTNSVMEDAEKQKFKQHCHTIKDGYVCQFNGYIDPPESPNCTRGIGRGSDC